MNMDDIAQLIQSQLTKNFVEWLTQKHPNITWTMTFDLQIMADDGKDAAYEAMTNAIYPKRVASYTRRSRKGGIKRVDSYQKVPKSLTAMDMAVLEANEEDNTDIGVDIEAELEEFLQAIMLGQTTLGNMNFSG